MKALLFLALASASAVAEMVDPGADVKALPTAPDGFEVKEFAREPLVRQPCSMAFDARGRLFIGMGPQYRNPKPDTPADSVVIVEDTNGDGVADRVRVFATGFNAVQALAWHGGDLWVANSPDLTIVRDLDGDDVADEYVRVFTDLGNLEHGLHGLVWAPDGKLYMSKGNSKGMNMPDRYAPKPFRELWGLPTPASAVDFPPSQTFKPADYRHAYHDPKDDWGLMGGVLRCDDGGKNLEIVARGFRNPWDIAFDGGFNWLATDNDQNEGDRVMMPFFGAHFGWNHPWSAHWTGEGHLPTVPVSAPVFNGSGTGIVCCGSPQFPPEYRGAFFINDWLRKTMFVFRPQWDGALMRVAGGEWERFIVGGKSLFRPTDMAFGPDGALWCLGWSRGYGAEWKDGEMTNEGRVYRIAWKGASPRPLKTTPLAERGVKEMLADFANPVAVCRVDAQEELIRRGAKAELLAALESGTLDENGETWSAWAFARSGGGSEFFIRALLPETKASLNLRVQSLQILARLNALPESVRELLTNAEPRLRFEAVQAIWQAQLAALIPALVDLAAREPDRLTYYSVWRALRDLAGTPALKAMLNDPRGGVRRAALLALLEDGALSRDEVQKLSSDADEQTKALAESWLKITDSGGPKVLVKGPEQGPPITGPAPTFTPPPSPTALDAALAAMAGADPQRGRLLVLHPAGAGCVACHFVGGHGNQFGPDLTGIGDRADARHLLESMIDPSAVITEGFHTHVIETANDTFSGVLLDESGVAVTIGLATGQRVRVLRADIVKHETLPTSAMPPFAALLGPQECADIGAWLLTQKAGKSKKADKARSSKK
jgi:putative membrane-bound dehydrogenase-like protein